MLTGDNFHGKPVDIWACGVTLYMFVYGHPPFEAKTMTELYARILVRQVFTSCWSERESCKRDKVTSGSSCV